MFFVSAISHSFALPKFLHDAVQHNLHPFQIMRPLVGIHHSFLNNAFIVKYWHEGVGRNTHYNSQKEVLESSDLPQSVKVFSIKLQRPKQGQSKICRGFRTTGVKEVMKIPPARGKKKMPVASFQSPTKLALQAALARLA